MNTKYIGLVLFACLLFFGLVSCEEKEWSEDYDIDYPVSTITSITPMQQVIGGEVTLTGSNLQYVLYVSIGNLRCGIVSKETDQIVFTVPAGAQNNFISVENIYMRRFVFPDQVFVPLP